MNMEENMNKNYVETVLSEGFDSREDAYEAHDNLPHTLWQELKSGEQISVTRGLVDKKWYVIKAINQS